MSAVDVGCSEKRSLLRWASKLFALGIEANCIFCIVKHPAPTHLTEDYRKIYLKTNKIANIHIMRFNFLI